MKRSAPLKRRTHLRPKGQSDTAVIKDQIQALARAIVIIRDGGCILRNLSERYPHTLPQCGGYRNDDELILQADHLITRANGATFADIRLIVCICRDHHAWKSKGSNARKNEYDHILKHHILEPERIALWEKCERESWKPTRSTLYDWQKELAFLTTKLRAMDPDHPLLA